MNACGWLCPALTWCAWLYSFSQMTRDGGVSPCMRDLLCCLMAYKVL